MQKQELNDLENKSSNFTQKHFLKLLMIKNNLKI